MPTNIDDAAAGLKLDPSLALPPDYKHEGSSANHAIELPLVYEGQPSNIVPYYSDEDNMGEFPTEEELHTLRRVADKIPWMVYTIAFVELCERFSYYGTTVVCKFNDLLSFCDEY